MPACGEFVEGLFVLGQDRSQFVVGLDPDATLCSEFASARLAKIQQSLPALGNVIDVTGPHDETRVAEDCGGITHIRCQARDGTGHGLADDVRKSFSPGCQRCYIERGCQSWHVGAHAEQVDRTGQSLFRDPASKGFVRSLAALSDEDEPGRGMVAMNDAGRPAAAGADACRRVQAALGARKPATKSVKRSPWTMT